jgi:hypothetical protein
MMNVAPNPQLPPHLREVCDILARGLLRLRSRGMPAETTGTTDRRDIPLHFIARRSASGTHHPDRPTNAGAAAIGGTARRANRRP